MNRLSGFIFLYLALSAASANAQEPLPDPVLPFDMPSLQQLRASPKKVFAHYFTPFPLSIDNKEPHDDYYTQGFLSPTGESGKHLSYGGLLRERPLPQAPIAADDWFALNYQEEVRRAIAIGLDGFSVDMLSYEGIHWDRLLLMLDAARDVDPDFKILLMPDMNGAFGDHPEKLAASILSLASHPSVFRQADGRLVVSPYNAQKQSAAWWTGWLVEMNGNGVDVSFVPLFQGWQAHADDFAPISDGFSDWGWRTPTQAAWRDVPNQAHEYVPIWMAPVAPQAMVPRSLQFWEAGNSETFRVMWRNAILGDADWVQIITWNDYSEHAEIAPSSGTQFGFYDLSAYYITHFKTGRPPALRRDALYYFYRTQATDAQPNLNKQARAFELAPGSVPARDEIELLAFLTAPGTLEIEIAGQTHRQDAPAGMTSFRVPLLEGRPTFRLLRNGWQLIDLPGAFTISNQIEYQDLLYRAGGSTRAPLVAVEPGNGNQAPVITGASASPTAGLTTGSTVTFSGNAFDPDGDNLTYTWTFGNGVQSPLQNANHAYAEQGRYEARLHVSDGVHTTTLDPPIVVSVGDPPSVAIVEPFANEEFEAGSAVMFSALATGADETLGESAFTWTVRRVHDEHTHADVGSMSGSSYGSFQIPSTGHTFAGDTGFEISVEVRDSAGLTATDSVIVRPKKVNIELRSQPVDVALFVDQSEMQTPVVYDTAINFEHVLTAPIDVCDGNARYRFVSWSNGQPGSHLLTVPSADLTLTASYEIAGSCVGTDNLAPHALADTASVVASGATAVAVLDNDGDADGFLIPDTVQVVAQPGGGTTSVDPFTGVIHYLRNSSAPGPDSFTYTVKDNLGTVSNEATVVVTVTGFPTPVFDGPSALDFDGSNGDVVELPHSPGYELAAGSILFSFNASDTSGAQGLFSKDAALFSGGGNHFLAWLEDSVLTVRLQNGATQIVKSIGGIAAGVTYRIAVTFGPNGSNIYVNGQLAVSDAFVMDWSNGPNIEYMQWGGRGWASVSGQPGFDAPFEGTISGRQIYDVPLTGAQIASLHADSPPNAPPTARANAFVTGEDAPLIIAFAALLANDSDDDGDTVSVSSIASEPTNGTASLDAGAATITYTPTANFNGADSFQVQVGDGNGGFDTSNVNVTVTPVNDAPIANSDSASTLQGLAVVIDVIDNDTDADGDGLFVLSLTGAANGIVSLNPDGTVTYTPDATFRGADSFGYLVSDGTDSAIASVSVNVTDTGVAALLFDEPGLVAFDGTDSDVIELPHSPLYEIGEGSILFAFTAADTDGAKGLFAKDASLFGGGGNHLLVWLDGSTLKARFQNGSTEFITGVSGIAAGLTYHVAITFGPDGSEVFVDGRLAASDPFVMDWSSGPNIEYIQWGGRGWVSASGEPGFDAPFKGTIANRQIYDVALSEEDVALLSGGIVGPVSDALVARFESDANVVDGNGVVTGWSSTAGTGINLLASGDPRLVPGATPSGQAAISLDGGLAAYGENGTSESDKLESAAPGQSLVTLPGGNTPRSMYFVVDYKTANATYAGVSYGAGSPNNAFGLVLNGNGNNLTVQGWGHGNDFPAPQQDGIGNNDGSVTDDWFVHSVRYDGTAIRHYRDGQLIGTNAHTFTTAVEKLVVGAEIANFGASALDVAALLIYDKELSDIEHTRTVEFLTKKYLIAPVTAEDTPSTVRANTPPVADRLVAQFESDAHVVNDNGVVSEWHAATGAGMTLVGAGDPLVVQGVTPSGLAAISLDGGLAAFGEDGTAEGDALQHTVPGPALDALPGGNAPRSMYFVVDYKAANGTFAGASYGSGAPNNAFGLVLDGNGNRLTVQGWGHGNDFPAAGENGIGNNDGSVADDWFVHSVRYDGTTIRHYRDYQLIGTESHEHATVVEKFVIGAEIANFGFSALDVAAVLVYDGELSDNEHLQAVEYLTNKYLVVPQEDEPPAVAY